MTDRLMPCLSIRKEPKQARSIQLITDILAAATQVLARDGARRFTTARVAEKAGVSVGSIYQYFPNKEAILFRLQAEEWKQTSGHLSRILNDTALPPFERVRKVVREFVRSECEEAVMRIALGDAAPLYRDTPELHQVRLAVTRTVRGFMREVLPHASNIERRLAADVVAMSLVAVGKQLSEAGYEPGEIDARVGALEDMFCAYLERLSGTVSATAH